MRAVVFAGPSIEVSAVSAYQVEVLPPVQRGDIDDLISAGPQPDFIGIIDGQFLQSLMISPKEILQAMDRHQIMVFGASSMGALRAAELADYGMIGVGEVYDLYRSGKIDEDDEVAIVFDPESLRPLCEPMVNFRIVLATARARGIISGPTAESALAAAKELYFPDRTYRRMLAQLSGRAADDELLRLASFLGADPPNAKRRDAIAMLDAMRQAMTERGGSPAATQ